MRSKITLAALLMLIALGAASFFLHRHNTQLTVQVAALRLRADPLQRLAAENDRTRQLIARADRDATAAARDIHQNLLRLRDEVASLETAARTIAAKKAAAVAARAANRDPEKDFTALENFQNVGRATPAATVQTLIWAALKPDESALLASIALSADARAEAERILSQLPEPDHAKYPTPESLAALVVMNEVLRADAAQIASTTPVDFQHGSVLVRVPNSDDTARVFTELTSDGWRVVISKRLILNLKKPPPSPAPPPKG